MKQQIIGSFEDIGKDIIREASKVPGDLVGKALESLGTSNKKPQQPKSPADPQNSQTTDAAASKPVIPRQWLEELAGKNKKQHEPTVQERLEKQDKEKQEKENKQTAQAQKMAPIMTGSSKPKRGNLYGVKQKASSEMSKNVRQD